MKIQPVYISRGLYSTFFLFVFSCILFTSCETITEIDLPEEKPQLVVNAVFNADSLVKVDLSQSKSVNSSTSTFKAVENASIEVFKNSASLGFLNYKGNGQYFSTVPLPNDPGAEYSLKVRASGFETAEAAEVMPAEPLIGDLKLVPNSQNNSTYKSYKSTFALHDAPNENYYCLRVWLVDKNNSKSSIYVGLNNTLGQFEPNGMMSRGVYLFDDKSFNGKTVTLNIDMIQGVYVNTNNKYRIMIELVNTGKSFFTYQYDVQKQSNGSSVFNPEKSPIYNNIKNGLGIFAPYNSATLEFAIE